MWRCAAERAAHSGNFQGRRMFQAGFKLNLPAVFPPSARLIALLKTVTASPPRCSTEEIKHKRNRNRREVSCAWNGNKATSANLFLLHVLFSSTLQKDKPCFSLFIHNKTGDELSWAPLQAFTCQRPEHSNPLLFYPPELICLFFICAVWLQKKRKNKLQPSHVCESLFFLTNNVKHLLLRAPQMWRSAAFLTFRAESLSFRLSFAKKKQSEDVILGSGKLSKWFIDSLRQ